MALLALLDLLLLPQGEDTGDPVHKEAGQEQPKDDGHSKVESEVLMVRIEVGDANEDGDDEKDVGDGKEGTKGTDQAGILLVGSDNTDDTWNDMLNDIIERINAVTDGEVEDPKDEEDRGDELEDVPHISFQLPHSPQAVHLVPVHVAVEVVLHKLGDA